MCNLSGEMGNHVGGGTSEKENLTAHYQPPLIVKECIHCYSSPGILPVLVLAKG